MAKVNDLRDRYGNTALHCAARCGMLDAAKYLVEEAGADANLKNYIGETVGRGSRYRQEDQEERGGRVLGGAIVRVNI